MALTLLIVVFEVNHYVDHGGLGCISLVIFNFVGMRGKSRMRRKSGIPPYTDV